MRDQQAIQPRRGRRARRRWHRQRSAGAKQPVQRGIPPCPSCGERAEVDEIDLIVGFITFTCEGCQIAWTEPTEVEGLTPRAEMIDWSHHAELSRFDDLEGPIRNRVLVRVLCGLVALEDEPVTAPD